MYDTLALRILALDYTRDVPPTRKELAQLINDRVMKVESTINNIERKKLPPTLGYKKYKGELTDLNFVEIFRNYYMIDNDEYKNIPIINILYSFDEKKFNIMLQRMGLKNFKGNSDDLLTLLNIQVGLPWENENVKDICLIPVDRITSITGLSYVDSLLIYITGFYLDVDNIITEGSTSRKIIAYTAFRTLPFIKRKKRRPIEHVSMVVSQLDMRMATSFIENISFAIYMQNITAHENYLDEALSKMGIIKKDMSYVLHSLEDYKNVKHYSLTKRPILDAHLSETLSTYSDDAILSAIEVNVDYEDRYSLIRSAIEEFTTFKWSLESGRGKYCRDEYDVKLTYGRAMNYTCYDLMTLWINKEDNDIRSEAGLRLNDTDIYDLNRYIYLDEVESLMITLTTIGYDGIILELLNSNNTKYIGNVMKGKNRLLVICSDDGGFSDASKSLLQRKGINLDELRIDYVTPDLMKIDGIYYTINDSSFGDKTSLDIMKNDEGTYEYVIYDNTNNSNLFSMDTLGTIYNKLDKNGRIYILVNKDNEEKLENVSEYFVYENVGNIGRFNAYEKKRITLYEKYLGVGWNKKWEIVDNQAGGNCMYHAIAIALGKYNNDVLRQTLIDNIPENMLDNMKIDVVNDKLIKLKLDMQETNDVRRRRGDMEKALEAKKDKLRKKIMQELTLDDIKASYLDCNKWGTTRELKILSDVLGFIPIVLSELGGDDLLCSAVDYSKVIEAEKLDNIIVLIQSGGHYTTLKEKDDGKGVFSEDELPEELIAKFRKSCLKIERAQIPIY